MGDQFSRVRRTGVLPPPIGRTRQELDKEDRAQQVFFKTATSDQVRGFLGRYYRTTKEIEAYREKAKSQFPDGDVGFDETAGEGEV